MCTRIDHMENLQGRSFADDILPGYQSEEELEALEEQRRRNSGRVSGHPCLERKKSRKYNETVLQGCQYGGANEKNIIRFLLYRIASGSAVCCRQFSVCNK